MGPELIERAVRLRQGLGAAGGLAAVERFIGTQRGLSRADRDLVLDWADNNVRGVFEVRAPGQPPGQPGAVSALNLVDDLDYLVYGLVAAGGPRQPGGFFAATLLPLADDDSAWLAAGDEIGYPRADARQVARLAIDLATREPDLVFRNQEKATQGWAYMRRDREEFVAFFGARRARAAHPGGRGQAQRLLQDAPRLRARRAGPAPGGQRRPARPRSSCLRGSSSSTPSASSTTSSTGSSWCPSTGCCGSCSPTRRSPPTRGTPTCCAPTCARTPSRRCRCAGWRQAFPGNVDAVFRRVLGNRNFSWSQNGSGLLRKRKPGYFGRSRRPGVAVLSDRVLALARGCGLGLTLSGPRRDEVRVELDERVDHAQVGERGERPRRRLAVQARPGTGRVQQAVHLAVSAAAGSGRSPVGPRRRWPPGTCTLRSATHCTSSPPASAMWSSV